MIIHFWVLGDIVVGDGTSTKADGSVGYVQVSSGVKSIAAGTDTAFYIKEDDTLWGWGNNAHAQLGNMSDSGDNNVDTEFTPVKILDEVKHVSNSGRTVLAVRLDGSLYSWGSGTSKGIYTENGWVENAGSPYKVMDNVRTTAMIKNGSGVLVIKEDDTLWGWGTQWNNEGSPETPYKYADNVSYVSCGERHAAVVKKDGTLWSMGGNYRKGLGYPSTTVHYSPLTKVLSDVQDAPAAWAQKEVEEAIGAQLIPESLQSDYSKAITREEFCILAIRMIEVKSEMTIEAYLEVRGFTLAAADTFIDTSNKDVLAAKALGITSGTSPTTFDPTGLLTREQAAKFLSATASAVGKDIKADVPNYADVNEIAKWAQPYTGYVYNIGVMKGVGGNRFDSKGSYQRQQAFMTMYRIWKSLDQVSLEKIEPVQAKVIVVAEAAVTTSVSPSTGPLTIENLKTLIAATEKADGLIIEIKGKSVDPDGSLALNYKGYYKGDNIRIDTLIEDKLFGKTVYNHTLDETFSEIGPYGEVYAGNILPIRTLNIAYLEKLDIDTNNEFFTARYDFLNGEKVLYIESSIKNGIFTKMWYSLKYLTPLKFNETWDVTTEGGPSEIDWEVVKILENQNIDKSLFEKTGTMEDLLLYKVKSITANDESLGGKQILYYSEESFESLVIYFDTLLKGTEDYSIYKEDKKTSIDGTLNGNQVIVIINNFMKTEAEVKANGVNVNWFNF